MSNRTEFGKGDEEQEKSLARQLFDKAEETEQLLLGLFYKATQGYTQGQPARPLTKEELESGNFSDFTGM